MTTTTQALSPAALRRIAKQVIQHRRRVATVYRTHGYDEARIEVSMFVLVGSRPKFLVDHADHVEFYALCKAMGRELDRLHGQFLAEHDARALARETARGYRSPALAAAP